MAQTVYLLPTGPKTGKAAIALGLLETLVQRVGRIAVYRPLAEPGADRPEDDGIVSLLRGRYDLPQAAAASVGGTYADLADPEALVETAIAGVAALRAEADLVLVVGSDFTGPSPATELELNARLAANLGSPVLVLLPALGRRDDEVLADATSAYAVVRESGGTVLATLANRAHPDRVAPLAGALRALPGAQGTPAYVLPELPLLEAPTVAEVRDVLGATVLAGQPALLEREVEQVVVGSGLADSVLPLLRSGTLLVTAGDRTDLLATAVAAAAVPDAPTPAGVLLTLGARPSPAVEVLLRPAGMPVLLAAPDTYGTLRALEGLRGRIRPTSDRKIAAALGLFAAHVDGEELTSRVRLATSDAVTPLMFSARLLEQARSDRRRIVLPEGDDDRVLLAADEILRRGVAHLTLLGDPVAVAARASRLGVHLDAAEVVDPATSPLRQELAETYARLRAHKGVTLEQATDVVLDPSYFGTLLVHSGRVDGMVSGAAHTTAATIRPALEVIKTVPEVSLVSSCFLMCLADRVLVFADCAVVPDPDAAQLADIALSTVATASAFGIEPRVALVSYSTGTSGRGADVEKVAAATRILTERQPDLPLAGPVQYDAAVDPAVGALKMPGNPVAGRATVLVFPDLNTGNTTYKAVQRAAGAIAIGPVLQGLRAPVNDLSRGCTVPDIVHTVAITAVQAQQQDPQRDRRSS